MKGYTDTQHMMDSVQVFYFLVRFFFNISSHELNTRAPRDVDRKHFPGHRSIKTKPDSISFEIKRSLFKSLRSDAMLLFY